MPVFEYHCSCGLHFEKMRPRRKAQDAVTCERCSHAVTPELSAPSFAFGVAPVDAGPQNTGVASIDFDADNVIGADSQRRWKAVAKRQTRKKKILKSTGAEGKDLSRTFEGDYTVMKPEERAAAETARDMHHTAMDQIREAKGGKRYLATKLGQQG